MLTTRQARARHTTAKVSVVQCLARNAQSGAETSGAAAGARQSTTRPCMRNDGAAVSEASVRPKDRGSPWSNLGKLASKAAPEEPTELIFNLYNRGEGWGEEIIPHITVQKRKVGRRSKKLQDAWEPDSIEARLVAVGVQEDCVDAITSLLTAWRVTRQGRHLKDKKRWKRVHSNIPLVVQYLHEVCGVPLGASGTGALIQRFPLTLLCKPSGDNDRFWRNALRLAAFTFTHGHGLVPSDGADGKAVEGLARWCARQRVAFADGFLDPEKEDILNNLQFDFGLVALITPMWEIRFDLLLECLGRRQGCSGGDVDCSHWNALHWVGDEAGSAAAAWVLQQRALHRQGKLVAEAVTRLEAIGMVWDSAADTEEESAWLCSLGDLLVSVDCVRSAKSAAERRLKPKRSSDRSQGSTAQRTGHAAAVGGGDQEAPGPGGEGAHAVATLCGGRVLQLEAVEMLDLVGCSLPRGQRRWLERQRTLWRQNRLHEARVKLLYAAGIELNPYSGTEWRNLAHAATWLGVSWAPVPLMQDGCDAPAVAADDALQTRSQPSSCAPAASRLAVRRWVQTQQRLAAEGRLTEAQVDYMAALGLSWVLSPAATHLNEDLWEAAFHDLHACLSVSSGAMRKQSVSERRRARSVDSGSEHTAGRLQPELVALQRVLDSTDVVCGSGRRTHGYVGQRLARQPLAQPLAVNDAAEAVGQTAGGDGPGSPPGERMRGRWPLSAMASQLRDAGVAGYGAYGGGGSGGGAGWRWKGTTGVSRVQQPGGSGRLGQAPWLEQPPGSLGSGGGLVRRRSHSSERSRERSRERRPRAVSRQASAPELDGRGARAAVEHVVRDAYLGAPPWALPRRRACSMVAQRGVADKGEHSAPGPWVPPSVLLDWLCMQRGLSVLGMIPRSRERRLIDVVCSGSGEGSSASDDRSFVDLVAGVATHWVRLRHSRHGGGDDGVNEGGLRCSCRWAATWGQHIAWLIWFRRVHGDVDVPTLGEHEGLYDWIEDCKLHCSALLPSQVVQLQAAGVALHA